MFMVLSSWQSHCESSPSSFDECRMAPSGRRPKTKLDDLGCESAYTGCRKLHPPSPFIIITQPESWYSFYRPTEGRRLSRPNWLVTYRDGLPVHKQLPILVLTGSDTRIDTPTATHATNKNNISNTAVFNAWFMYYTVQNYAVCLKSKITRKLRWNYEDYCHHFREKYADVFHNWRQLLFS